MLQRTNPELCVLHWHDAEDLISQESNTDGKNIHRW
jgi:hypothetical protein